MKQHNWRSYIPWILFAEVVGALSGWLTRAGAQRYELAARKPPLSPPGAVFPVVWSILFGLMGAGAARIARTPASKARARALLLFVVQLVFNFFWSIFFFNLQNYALAFVWLLLLWLLIVGMILAFYPVDRLAAWMQVPYLLWVTFAAYLNYGAWMLNRPAF